VNIFIVGAGFTKALFPDAPLNRDLLRILANKFPAAASAVLRDQYNTDDIEIALTRLDVDLALSQEQELRKRRRCIENELVNYFSSFCASENLFIQSQWLASLIDKAFFIGDVAVSLNYDCVLEGALDYCGKWSPNAGYGSFFSNPLVSTDSFKSSAVTVLKIHGSANFVIAPYADKPTSSAVNFEFDEHFFPCSGKNTHYGYGAGTGKSYVIAPSYVKIPRVEISYLMLEALTASTRAKNLIIIGSALRPEDAFLTMLVTNFLHQPSWRTRKIIIVDPNAESISNRLKDYWGVNVSSQILPIREELQTAMTQLSVAIETKRMRRSLHSTNRRLGVAKK
jgi:hypothetical protein